ncbi:MAG: FecR domain-containing protein, partial [Acidobacteria bacterium]|nr:FecR domain-containing protein [Acidobacteriota bacterium]
MKRNHQELDRILDDTLSGIRRERADQKTADTAASRVWARVSAEAAGLPEVLVAPSREVEQISGCPDYRSLIPAYVRGQLSPARRLLLEDHTHECIPCRKSLREARTGVRTTSVRAKRRESRWTLTPAWRMAMAASFVAVFGFAAYFVAQKFDWTGNTLAATLENANGAIYKVTGTGVTVVQPGEKIKKGEHVRAAKDSSAVLKLADGSMVELRERSEFSVTENAQGTTINLERGDVIVEAAKQIKRHLFVSTPDSLVSVTGTTFAVASGTKGSRVSVVEGEVRFNHASKESVLKPGDQGVSSMAIERVPVAQEIAWSRNAAKYASVVTQLTALRHDLNQKIARPGVRYSSRFLDIVPDNTVVYAALPNISQQLAESHKIMRERISQNPALAEWWGKNHQGGGAMDDRVIERVREFGSYLGDEIVVAAGMDAKGEPGDIVVLGELKDAAGFRAFAEKQLAEMTKDNTGASHVKFIDDPLTAVATEDAAKNANAAVAKVETGAGAAKKTVAGKLAKTAPRREELYVWVANDLFVASPKLDAMRSLETNLKTPGSGGFVGGSFHQRLSQVYKEGAGLIVAADLEKIVGQALQREEGSKPDGERRMEGFRQLGLLSLKHFVVEQKDVNAKTQSRAVLTFNEPRRGIASWLAAPGPMGALEFVSPNANVATAFVVKEPALLVDDLFGFMETVAPDVRKQFRDIEAQQGFDIKRDFAAPLGGEFAFAIDGPLLPTPSWKMVLEVYDQPKLQQTFERAVEKLNGFAALHGQKGLAWENVTEGAQTYYRLRSVDFGFEVNYTYSNGYMIVAPTKAMLQLALQYRESGTTLLKSQRFTSSLPEDGNANFSALLYHDLAPLMQPIADKMSGMGQGMPEEQRKALAAFAADTPPTLAYAYAQGDRITIAANTEGGPFGLSTGSILGLPNAFAMQHILMQAMGGRGMEGHSKSVDAKVHTIERKVREME